jgi:hypothetical protein
VDNDAPAGHLLGLRDTVALNGTTVNELKQYHLETLNGVLDSVNRETAEIEAREQARREREVQEQTRLAHQREIADIDKKLNFD